MLHVVNLVTLFADFSLVATEPTLVILLHSIERSSKAIGSQQDREKKDKEMIIATFNTFD